AAGKNVFPCVGLIVSGGHTSLYQCASATDFHYLGGTIDDAAGEAFDKVASMLGLAYPGGPAISKAAERGNPRAFKFPRALGGEAGGLNFSFSGVKTAVRYSICGPQKADFSAVHLTPQQIADLAASFQEAVVDSLIAKTRLALEQTGEIVLCVGGGVAANHRLRQRLAELAAEMRIELHCAPPDMCTDNAVMGAIAFERLRAGKVEGLGLESAPGLVRK
ncbi:MAG: tRNA (adenosine(37)-N6)-threonylcarbamoyltransferase complex transferase subunit TsaD, partial [Pirellulaceae bacterium]|nr:tRNA (adenosine(37)-N6)-threonylcarbamoyltransferase complex transferase subunit TsaD [Pirellulaceae bacterium]